MKLKTSISLSSEILDKIEGLAPEGNRSEFIEKALWRYVDCLNRDSRNKYDQEIIRDSADSLNNEAMDVLRYQTSL